MWFFRYLLLIFSFFIPFQVQAAVFLPDATYETCFTPENSNFTFSCTDQIIHAINLAKAEILVQAYSFTSMPIAQALINSKKRGVDVEIILDKSQKSVKQRFSSAQFFRDYQIPVWIDTKVAIAHNKVMIIDKKTVVVGSFNFTRAAEERNAENVNIITDSHFAKLYLTNWYNRQAVSIPFEPQGSSDLAHNHHNNSHHAGRHAHSPVLSFIREVYAGGD